MRIDCLYQNMKESYWGLKARELLYGMHAKSTYPPLALALQRYKSCSHRKPQQQIRREIQLCKSYWGCYPWHYYLYDLYRSDNKLTVDQILDYVPEFFFYEVFLPYHNDRRQSVIFEDKSLMEQIFRALSIPHPYLFCKVIHGRLYSRLGTVLTMDQLNHDLKARNFETLCLKPIDGRGGNDVLLFHIQTDGSYATKQGIELTEDLLTRTCSAHSCLIQEGLKQVPILAKLYPLSINTLRITSETVGGESRLMTSCLRLGRNGLEVDNVSQEGIAVRVDLSTGALDGMGYTKECKAFDKHPDTGAPFAGHAIPNWDKVTAQVRQAAAKLYQFCYLGWDIALCPTGPLVIEVNLGFGIDAQNIQRGLRPALQLKDPSYYYHHKGRRSRQHG